MTKAITITRILEVMTKNDWYQPDLVGYPMDYEKFRVKMVDAELINNPYNAKRWWEDMHMCEYFVQINQYRSRINTVKVAEKLGITLPAPQLLDAEA